MLNLLFKTLSESHIFIYIDRPLAEDAKRQNRNDRLTYDNAPWRKPWTDRVPLTYFLIFSIFIYLYRCCTVSIMNGVCSKYIF